MKYIDTFKLLKSRVNYDDDFIEIDNNTVTRNFLFSSKYFTILPGERFYSCHQHDYTTDKSYNFDIKTGIVDEVLDIHDSQICDNTSFRYHVFSPVSTAKAKQIVLMLHGFNEKHWHKYLPWAKHIVETTGKTVVMFPIAFHMNRAPQTWSEIHMMYEASALRKQQFPNILHSSLSNVAISTRIHAKPQRFVWSGLQTYYDIIHFIEDYKMGKHPFIIADASIDIFAYSIGAFLAQILMMTNYKNYFGKSKLAMFCGGAVFNRLSPVSKFILDSEANVNLYSFIVEHLESHLKKDERLNHYLNFEHPEGISFRSMLNYKVMSDLRENLFRAMSNRMMALVLTQDNVVPPYEVVNTLQGKNRDIPVLIKDVDLPYPYKHEDPFPALEKIKDLVDENFKNVFTFIGNFLK
ncbi:MAG: DUF6051 family protein [Prevotellaceae bacterium]|jgi:hypothetical protein|nr:DUF6051 family protein [Prevotellaceae bacterium]